MPRRQVLLDVPRPEGRWQKTDLRHRDWHRKQQMCHGQKRCENMAGFRCHQVTFRFMYLLCLDAQYKMDDMNDTNTYVYNIYICIYVYIYI